MHQVLRTLLDLIFPILLSAPLAICIVVIYVRIIGLRSFSKMTSFDFITTIAIGSLLANAAVATQWIQYLQSLTAIAALLMIQVVVSKLRIEIPRFRSLIANKPVVLFKDRQFNDVTMARTRVTRSDVWAKIREANALNIDNIHAVVLETTGDISVLHGDRFDAVIMTGVE